MNYPFNCLGPSSEIDSMKSFIYDRILPFRTLLPRIILHNQSIFLKYPPNPHLYLIPSTMPLPIEIIDLSNAPHQDQRAYDGEDCLPRYLVAFNILVRLFCLTTHNMHNYQRLRFTSPPETVLEWVLRLCEVEDLMNAHFLHEFTNADGRPLDYQPRLDWLDTGMLNTLFRTLCHSRLTGRGRYRGLPDEVYQLIRIDSRFASFDMIRNAFDRAMRLGIMDGDDSYDPDAPNQYARSPEPDQEEEVTRLEEMILDDEWGRGEFVVRGPIVRNGVVEES